MTSWGLILLVGYVALGLSSTEPARAARLATTLTAAVLIAVSVKIGAL